MSLIGSFAQGAAQPMQQMTGIAMQGAQQDALMQKELAMKEEIQNRLNEYNTKQEGIQHARNRGETLADQQTQFTQRMAEIKAQKDPNAKAISDLTLKKLLEDAKVPSSVKTKYSALQETQKLQQSAMYKGMADGTFDETSPGAIALLKKIDDTSTAMNALIEPYLPKEVQTKPGEIDPNNPLGLNLPPLQNKPTATAANPTAPKQPAYDPIAAILNPHNVTPYADKVQMLNDLKPADSAPPDEISKWQNAMLQLQMSQQKGVGLINRQGL